MQHKVLIISSEFTGHGHKSIAESLREQYQILSPETEVIIKNGFQFGGRQGDMWERAYSPVTKYVRPVWTACFHITSKYCRVTNKYLAHILGESFIKYLKQEAPDLIVTVHGGFVGSLLDAMEKGGVRIPVAVVVADLVNLSQLWADRRAALTLCPTTESAELLTGWGIRKDRIAITGFPVRQRFCHGNELDTREASASREPSILLINGAERPETIIQVIDSILEKVNASITIVTGRDEKLRTKLLLEYNDKPQVIVKGYCKNLEELMRSHDILICRGSPNVLMEAVNCHIPVVMIGCFARTGKR